ETSLTDFMEEAKRIYEICQKEVERRQNIREKETAKDVLTPEEILKNLRTFMGNLIDPGFEERTSYKPEVIIEGSPKNEEESEILRIRLARMELEEYRQDKYFSGENFDY
ncbi:hypothetical protein HK096_007650, partial [Nowakowskiella sp. JEL0078]